MTSHIDEIEILKTACTAPEFADLRGSMGAQAGDLLRSAISPGANEAQARVEWAAYAEKIGKMLTAWQGLNHAGHHFAAAELMRALTCPGYRYAGEVLPKFNRDDHVTTYSVFLVDMEETLTMYRWLGARNSHDEFSDEEWRKLVRFGRRLETLTMSKRLGVAATALQPLGQKGYRSPNVYVPMTSNKHRVSTLTCAFGRPNTYAQLQEAFAPEDWGRVACWTFRVPAEMGLRKNRARKFVLVLFPESELERWKLERPMYTCPYGINGLGAMLVRPQDYMHILAANCHSKYVIFCN